MALARSFIRMVSARQGQRCTYEKAVEYLFNEITVIEAQLRKLNLGLDPYMTQALVSFIHSMAGNLFCTAKLLTISSEKI